MKKVVDTSEKPKVKRHRPAINPDARENQMISLAIDQAEKMLLEGKAPSQIVVHYLKLASSKERLEKEKLENENKVLRAKAEMIESTKRSEEFYAEALRAFKTYTGQGEADDEEL